jgi:hypothetical protein
VNPGILTEEEITPVGLQVYELTGFTLQAEKVALTCLPRPSRAASGGQMEINLAYSTIREIFKGLPLYKLSKKKGEGGEEYIEGGFISPQVGERYREKLQEAESVTGWKMGIAAEPNQHLIKERARALVPSSWGMRKEPGFFGREGYVRVKVPVLPPPDEAAGISGLFLEDTGFELKAVLE